MPLHSDLDRFVGALRADGPHRDLVDRMSLFGQFVGSWDLDVTLHDADGTVRTVDGEWYFGWALEGRAVVDVWICPSRRAPDRRRGETGITVRIPNRDDETWHSIWIGPAYGVVNPFVGRADGRDVVLDGSFEPGVLTRWRFTDIADDSFQWWNHISRDGGGTWDIQQHFHARRQA